MNMPPSTYHIQLRHLLGQCARQTQRPVAPSLRRQFLQRPQPFAAAQRSYATANPIRASQNQQEQNVLYKRKVKISAAGMFACAIAMYGVIHLYSDELKKLRQDGSGSQQGDKPGGSVKLDGPPGMGTPDPSALVIDGVEQVPTENSTIPHFPRTIWLPRSLDSDGSGQTIGEEVKNAGDAEEEYHLLGLGLRTVSFLRIQVYVVGLYIAQSDIAALHQRLVHQAATPAVTGAPPSDGIAATSLVPKEREVLKEALLDPEKGEEVWGQILRESGIRSAFRIVPTRNTDFLHLRDGWVRQVTGRAQKFDGQTKERAAKQQEGARETPEYSDDSFGVAMGEFKALLGGGVRKNVPKGQVLLMHRDKMGALNILFQPGDTKPFTWMGRVGDERISRLVWMGYLAGKNVASDAARKDVVDGVMRIVERPIGALTPPQSV